MVIGVAIGEVGESDFQRLNLGFSDSEIDPRKGPQCLCRARLNRSRKPDIGLDDFGCCPFAVVAHCDGQVERVIRVADRQRAVGKRE